MMEFGAVGRIAAESLGVHKLRTLLTMLGVIFGVAAVVSMLSIGEGAKREALQQISILGVNNVIVKVKPPDPGGGDVEAFRRSPGLSIEDGRNIARFSELVERVVPQRFESFASVHRSSREAPVRVVATHPEYVLSSSIGVEHGRFLNALDLRDCSQVCILGAKAKRELFAFEPPLGQVVRIGRLDFTVVGVMADKYIGRGKVEGFELKNLNEDVYIPFTTAVKKFGPKQASTNSFRAVGGGFSWSRSGQGPSWVPPEIDQLTVTVRDLRFIPAVTRLIDRLLERRHHGVTDYEIVVPESLIRQTQKTQRIFNVVMGAIAGLSLLVGGIGIMNIMLATVLERTREIGIRRAVGATRGDILRQFLVESVAICLIGCAAGLAFGLLLSQVISFYAGWPTVVSFYSILLAVGVSTLVGLVFGVYPAKKAAELNVIDALRYE
jgi:putative ABC transport system permease protein